MPVWRPPGRGDGTVAEGVEPALVVEREPAAIARDCRERCAMSRRRGSLKALRGPPALETFTKDSTVRSEEDEQQDAVSEIPVCLAQAHHGCEGQDHCDLPASLDGLRTGDVAQTSAGGELFARR